MALPKSIEDQGRRADELQQQNIQLQQSSQQQSTDSGGTPPPEIPPEPPAEPIVPAITDGPEAKGWEQRYRVLQGKYNSEIPRLQRENRQLQDDLNALKEEVQALKSAPPPPAPTTPVVKPEEVEQYGPEFVDLVTRIAKSTQPQTLDMSAVDARVRELNRPIEEVTVRSLKSSFFNTLGQMSPNWETLNTDQGFLSWLSGHDSLSGRTRQELFDEAYARLDAERVSAFFNGYGGPGVVSSAMVTPTTSRGQPPLPPGKRIWRQSEIAEFFSEVRQKRYSPEEAAKIEQDIFAAQAEGRVR